MCLRWAVRMQEEVSERACAACLHGLRRVRFAGDSNCRPAPPPPATRSRVPLRAPRKASVRALEAGDGRGLLG